MWAFNDCGSAVFAKERTEADIKQLNTVSRSIIIPVLSLWQGPDNVMGSDCDLLAAVTFAISVTLIIQTQSDTGRDAQKSNFAHIAFSPLKHEMEVVNKELSSSQDACI